MIVPKNFVSIKNKFARYLLILSILPMLIIGVISCILSLNALDRNAQELVESSTNRIASETDIILGNAVNIGNQIANDTSIQQSLRDELPTTDKELYALDLMLDTRLSYTQEQNDNIYAIYVIAENGGIYRSTYHTIRNEYMKETDWYQDAFTNIDPIWLEPHLGSYVGNSTEIPLMSVCINIQDKASDNSLGVVLVEIELSSIQYIYDQGFLDSGYTFLLNETGEPIVYSDTMSATNKEYYSNIISNRTSDYMYIDELSNESNFSTVSVVSYGNIYKDAVHIFIFVCIFAIILSGVSVALSRKFSLNISKPITALTDLMTYAKTGNLDVQMSVISNDEIGILSEKFNEMMHEINHYTAKEIKDLKRLQTSELETLQAQINPHFLYNTLDSVIWMARTGDNDEVVKMVSALTTFFRVSLSKGADTITIGQELSHLDSYLTIQSMRYASILSYETNVDDHYKQYFIPKLLLQPLVENSIYHGIKNIDRPGKITTTITEDERNLYIHIKDTGLGMDENTLEKLNTVCRTAQGKAMNSYGVVNVCRRMQILFGEEYYLKYESILEEGTHVTIPIPKKWKEVETNERIL